MKTQIIQLELHDDYISVRDRMEWGQTTRVLLVWPLRGQILNRRLDLLLLKRHSASLGSQLALVTRDRDVRYHADRLDIPVYKSIRQAEQSRWLRPRRRRKKVQSVQLPKTDERKMPDLETMRLQAHPTPPRWLNHSATRVFFFTLGVLSMLVIAALFIPSAAIYVTPATQTENVTIRVSASPEHQTVDLSGAVPTYWQSIIVEGRGSTRSTGETLIPRQTATGWVTFINLTEQELTIPEGTIISTQDDIPIRFRTTQETIVPTDPEGATVTVEALQPGSSGNVPAQTIVAIEGSLGLNLTVTNKHATSGGSDYTAAAPTQADYEQVYEQLVASLQETALEELQFWLEPDDVLLSSQPRLHQVLEESYIPEIGAPADLLELTLRLEFRIPYAAGADLYQLGNTVLSRQIPDNFTPRPETLQIAQLTEPISQESGQATWKIQATWQMGATLDEPRAVSFVLWLTPEQATQQLAEQMPITGKPDIYMAPAWWPRLPVLPFRIQIINQLSAQTQEIKEIFLAFVVEK